MTQVRLRSVRIEPGLYTVEYWDRRTLVEYEVYQSPSGSRYWHIAHGSRRLPRLYKTKRAAMDAIYTQGNTLWEQGNKENE